MVDSHDAETYSAKDSRLIWIDCEMTGLDIFGGDELVEVSVVPTDFDLNVLDEGVDYVIKPSEKAVNHMNDFVRQMHTRSGLINEWENGLSLAEAKKAGAVFAYGNFITILVNFILLAFIIFMMVKQINRLKREQPAAAPEAPPEEVTLLREIRDSLKR